MRWLCYFNSNSVAEFYLQMQRLNLVAYFVLKQETLVNNWWNWLSEPMGVKVISALIESEVLRWQLAGQIFGLGFYVGYH